MTVADTLPAGLTPGTLPTGTPWDCSALSQTVTCTSDAVVAANGSYPTLTIPVNVANNAGASANNQASVSGGGAAATNSNTDTVTITPAPVLALSKTHSGSFNAGQTAEWDITVSNTAAASSITNGTVTVTDTLPAGYTLNNYSPSPAWNCSGSSTVTCTSTQGVAGGSSFPTIALTVNVPSNSPSSVTNTAKAFGGGDLVHTNSGNGVSGSDSNVPVNPAQVAVPDVVGDTQAAATTAITGAGLVVGTVTTQASGTVPAGNVISQNPTAPTLVNLGSAVNLVVSSGPAQVAVPNVVGDTQSAASTAITGAGLVVGTVTPQASSTVPAGNVISQNPTAPTLVNVGSAVNLVVSSGPAQVAVPNVVGDTQAAATTAITGAGLVVGTVTPQASSTVPAGNVISQNPTAPTLVNVGSAVNLVVSSGPAQVAVPNVVGDTQAAATTAITGAGLVVGTVTPQASSTVPAGNVISQNPTAPTLVNVGSAVNLVVSSGPAQVAVPNVVGDTQAAATTAITGAGLVVGTVTPQASSTVPAGNVISQNPTAPTLVNVGSAVNLVVSSGPAQYLLTTAASPANGGIVTPAPPGGLYTANSIVPLTATAAQGFVFAGWTGPVANASSASTTVTMSAAESVTANFTATSILSIVPGSINFGTIVQYKGVTQLLLVTNNTNSSVKFTKISLGSFQNITSQYLLYDGGCLTTLAPGKYCRINITIAPNVTGNVSAILTLQDNGPGNPQMVPITATVIGPKASLSPSSLSFGNQGLNTPSTPKTVTLTNTGVGPLTITGIAITGSNVNDFSISTNTCVSPLGQGLSCTVGITFTPKAKSSRSANVTFTDNSTASSTQSVALSGKGT